MTEIDNQAITVVPFSADPVQVAAQQVLADFSDRLPNLADVVILLAEPRYGYRFRRTLSRLAQKQGYPALLGPRIASLKQWIEQISVDYLPAVTEFTKQLMLVEALRQCQPLFGEVDHWKIADSLLQLFNEITLEQGSIPTSLEDFTRFLQSAYNVDSGQLPHLGQEASIIHTLWHALNRQLLDQKKTDANHVYLYKLKHYFQFQSKNTKHYFIVPCQLSAVELDWVQEAIDHHCMKFFLQGSYAPNHSYHFENGCEKIQSLVPESTPNKAEQSSLSFYLDAVFSASAEPIRDRALELVNQVDKRFAISPVQKRIQVAPAANDEKQANLVSLQVRKWLANGLSSIAVVTENRKLARRVRALLERANIHIQDSAGWALSTTSAAAVIERWLQTVEEDFSYTPLLDLLKMDLMQTNLEKTAYRHLIFRFEQDIIVHEKVTRNIQRYRKHIHYRLKRLHWPKATAEALFQLLDRLQLASQPLRELINGKNHSAAGFIDALLASLHTLGIEAKLSMDAAGSEIYKQIQQLRISAISNPLTLNWLEFRGWMGYCLENTYFKPPADDHRVQLCNLEQSHLGRFDAIVIAAVEQEYLPGERSVSPYFNDHVRSELGLRTWKHTYHTRLYWFRELLESAPQVLLTYAQEKEGAAVVMSPWLNALQTFHWICYKHDLVDQRLVEQNNLPESQVTCMHPVDLPSPAAWPSAVLPKALIPKTMSAASHQRLMDCPYQFFLADALRLAPLEVIQQALEKSDFGERVHQCLEAFHSGGSPYNGALKQEITITNRLNAIDTLVKITEEVFSKDLEDNFLHRGWIKRWLKLIPSYIDWQIQQQENWYVHETESRQETLLPIGVLLNGRLDRIDQDHESSTCILDYKTGSIPAQIDVDHGEAVQLLTYALLMETAHQIAYVKISDPKVAIAASVTQPQLNELRSLTLNRLSVVLTEISENKKLPAWGDEKVCQHCKMDGICRKQTWLRSPHSSSAPQPPV